VNKFLCLFLNGSNDSRMAMTGGSDRNTGGKIQEMIPIDIPHVNATTMIHHKGITTWIRR
jgi:hypothetical protein